MHAKNLDSLFLMVDQELSKHIGTSASDINGADAVHRRRLLSSKDLFFFYLFSLSGSSEGAHGINISHIFWLGKSVASNYFSHCSLAVFNSKIRFQEARVQFPTA